MYMVADMNLSTLKGGEYKGKGKVEGGQFGASQR